MVRRWRENYRDLPMARLFLTFLLILFAGPAASETVKLERQRGTYMVPVRLNNAITLPFVLDTGASEVTIPADVFLTLQRTGSVKPSDLIGTGTYILADGSKQRSDRFTLHELKVGDHILKNVIANVVGAKGDPLLGQSFLSRIGLWALDNTHHVLILSDGEDASTQSRAADDYGLFVQRGWIISAKGLLSQSGHQLVFRRYAYRQDLNYAPNVMLFFCSSNPDRWLSNIDIIVPTGYQIKSFARADTNPKLPVHIVVDDSSTYHFEADYENGEMFIDRTPANRGAFDAVINARELLIGFGVGDVLHFYMSPNMDRFLKEASAAIGAGALELGDTTFVDGPTASKLCNEFQSGKLQ